MIHEIINPQQVAKVDVAVFIPSHNEASTIALPTRKVAAGLQKFYPNLSSVIVNCDNGSNDGTREAFFEAEGEVPRIYVSTPPGMTGKGANLSNVFQVATELSAKAVVVVDANLLSIKTTWVKSLLDPILQGLADYVAPLYLRHKYDAPISRTLVYPVTRALLGRRVLQPICVDHAFSGRLVQIYLKQKWELDDRGYKSDLQFLATAETHKMPICQSFMAHPRVATVGDFDQNLAGAFGYVAQALFNLMLKTWDLWSRVKRSRPTILAGVDDSPMNSPPQVEINHDFLLKGFLELGRQSLETWAEIFPPEIAATLEREFNETARKARPPEIPIELWCQIIYGAAVKYKNSSQQLRQVLVKSLAPLFLAKELSTARVARNLTGWQYKALLENEALAFETAKSDLVTAWGEVK